jgi:hypothetical protein
VCPHNDEPVGEGPTGGHAVDDDVPPEFYDLVDRFFDLANELTHDHATSRVSAVIMFAAARYNAHCLLSLDPDALDNREAAVSYFVGQYRSMLEDNIDWLAQSRRRE